MKNKLFIILISFTLPLIFTMCDNETNHATSDKRITFLKTDIGGCNGQGANDLKSTYTEPATVIISKIGDTLNIFVGINYICCAPFISEAEIINDSLIMTITDTCPDPYQSCYCRCMCYYTWDFQFIDFEEKEYFYKVELNDPREDDIIIFREGKIDLSKNN